MNNKGKRIFRGSSSSDIFFTKPIQPSLNSSSSINKPISPIQKSFNQTTSTQFSKSKLINNTSSFEINPNNSCDIIEVKKTLNRNGINVFNIKHNCSSLSRNKIGFDTIYIDPKDKTFKSVKEELKSKGIEINRKNNNYSFIRHDNIIPAGISYVDIRNYSKVVPRSSSQINLNNGRKYIVTKNGFSDTKFKNFAKENRKWNQYSHMYNKKE